MLTGLSSSNRYELLLFATNRYTMQSKKDYIFNWAYVISSQKKSG